MAIEAAPYAPRYVLQTLPCHIPTANIAESVDLDEIADPLVESLHHFSAIQLAADAVWRDLFTLPGTTRNSTRLNTSWGPGQRLARAAKPKRFISSVALGAPLAYQRESRGQKFSLHFEMRQRRLAPVRDI